jgi:predicted O-methyltransferase YrrM
MRVMSSVHQILQDPVEAYHKAVSQWHERDDPGDTPCEYIIDENWRQRIGVSSADRERTDRECRWIEATLAAKGIRPGPESYLFWNDGDPAFLQAIWCLIQRLNAAKVVETGVAHGVTTRIILEALNGRGHLWSVDLPPVWAPEVHREIGAAVGDRSVDQWSLIFGSSRRRLPRLLPRIAPIDLFIHDSHHSRYNMLFEMKMAWTALRPGGAMIVDDIDLNQAFAEFTQSVCCERLICEAEPIRPDERRFNGKGVFGILLKPDDLEA